MKRKVVKQGSSTLMVSLPSEWTQRYKIMKGDEIEVEPRGRTVIISTQKEYTDKETELNIDNLYPVTLRTVAAIYKAGYDKLRVTFTDPKRIIDVQGVVRNEISGFEVIEQGKNYCVVKKIEEGLEEGFEPVLRRIFLLLLNMAEDAREMLKNAEYAELERLLFLEESNNRLTTYCRRFLSKRGYKEPDKIQFIYCIIEEMEKIADQYKFLFKYLMEISNKKHKLSKEALEFYDGVCVLLRTYYELFYKFDKEKLVKIGVLRKKLAKSINEMIEVKGPDAVVIHYLSTIMELIFDMVSPYLSMVL
jgi:phosphate uptake regulator